MKELMAQAVKARENAYCKYSGFAVGAALLGESGRVYLGSNFENAAFGAGVCAERVALGAALTAGERRFRGIAVCGGDAPCTPCGVCRQALMEFGDMDVFCADASGEQIAHYRLRELLPGAFTEF